MSNACTYICVAFRFKQNVYSYYQESNHLEPTNLYTHIYIIYIEKPLIKHYK